MKKAKFRRNTTMNEEAFKKDIEKRTENGVCNK